MGMTSKQFSVFVRLVLDDILDVIEKIQDGEAKDELQRLADNLQKTIEDWPIVINPLKKCAKPASDFAHFFVFGKY